MNNRKSQPPKVLVVFSAPIVYSQHIRQLCIALSDFYDIHICTNLSVDPSYISSFDEISRFCLYKAPFSRKISPLADLSSLYILTRLICTNQYSLVLSFTPKGGLITSIANLLSSFFVSSPIYIHYFTGLLWPHLNFFSPIRLSFCCLIGSLSPYRLMYFAIVIVRNIY